MKREKNNEMIQSAVRLPRSLHERLKKAGGRRGMGEEIRRRLQSTLEAAEAPVDEITGEVLHQIKDVLRDYPEWHADRFVYDVVRGAIDVILSIHRPSDEGKPETKARLQALYYGQETAEAIGRIIGFVAVKAYARDRMGKASLKGSEG